MCKILRSWLLHDVLSLCTWGAFNKFAKWIETNLCTIRILRSANSQSANSRSVSMLAQVDNSEKLRTVWRICLIILFFPVRPWAWENCCVAWKRETCLVCSCYMYLHGMQVKRSSFFFFFLMKSEFKFRRGFWPTHLIIRKEIEILKHWQFWMAPNIKYICSYASMK